MIDRRTEVRDAATVIVARDTSEGLEVFLVRRHGGAVFLPDRSVFPGGAVDAADRADAPRLVAGSAGAVDPAYVLTAARETFEEVGLLFADRVVAGPSLDAARRRLLAGEIGFAALLDELDARVDATQLAYFSRWITPEGELARRFDARFFVARAPVDQVAEADAAEVTDGRWLRPAQALAEHARGTIAMIFPTLRHLARIAPFATVDDLLAFARTKRIVTVTPHLEPDGTIAMAPEFEDAW